MCFFAYNNDIPVSMFSMHRACIVHGYLHSACYNGDIEVGPSS